MKYLDARENLSVQVHPNEAYAELQRALRAARTELVVTDRRVLARTGVWRARVAEAAGASRVQDPLGRRLDYAHVHLDPDSERRLVVPFVAGARALAEVLGAPAEAGG